MRIQLLVEISGCVCNYCLVDFNSRQIYNDIVSADIIEKEEKLCLTITKLANALPYCEKKENTRKNKSAVRGVIYDWCLHDGQYDLESAVEKFVACLVTIFMHSKSGL